jgi:hypothetical protein
MYIEQRVELELRTYAIKYAVRFLAFFLFQETEFESFLNW